MKNLFKLSLLVGCFAFIATTTIYGQTITNDTPCEVVINYKYGLPFCGTITGGGTTTIGAGDAETLTLPAGTSLRTVAGGYTSTLPQDCGFIIGNTCTSFSQSQFVFCTPACGNYTATIAGGNVTLD